MVRYVSDERRLDDIRRIIEMIRFIALRVRRPTLRRPKVKTETRRASIPSPTSCVLHVCVCVCVCVCIASVDTLDYLLDQAWAHGRGETVSSYESSHQRAEERRTLWAGTKQTCKIPEVATGPVLSRLDPAHGIVPIDAAICLAGCRQDS